LLEVALNLFSELLILPAIGTRRALQPLVIATARNLKHLTQDTDPKQALMVFYPGVLHGWFTAKYAAAFFRMSRSSFRRLFS
jgi:hypothetical protein